MIEHLYKNWFVLVIATLPLLILARALQAQLGGEHENDGAGNRISVRPNSAVRWREGMILVCLVLPVLLIALWGQKSLHYIAPDIAKESAEMLPQIMIRHAALLCAATLFSAIVWAKYSAPISTILLLLALLLGTLHLKESFYHLNRDLYAVRHSPDFPIPIRIQLPDNIQGADVFLNGVHVGQTPIETTIQEVINLVPRSRNPSYEEEKSAQRDNLPFWNAAVPHIDKQYRRWGHLHLSAPDHSHTLDSRVELNGVPGYTDTFSPDQAKDGVQVYTLDTRFKAWEAEIDQLLDVARLKNYEATQPWYDAFMSYGAWGWNRLLVNRKYEPELQQLLDGCVQHAYEIEASQTPEQAWATLMKICDEAVETGVFNSDTRAGYAVNMLTDRLDPEQLFSHALKTISAPGFPPAYLNVHDEEDPLWRYVEAGMQSHEGLRWMPVFQALRQVDRMLDQNSPYNDNIIEQKVTSALLRQAYTNGSVRSYAAVLGSDAYDQFLLRQDWRTKPTGIYGTVLVGSNASMPTMRG